MIGKSQLTLNKDTVVKAVQQYLDNQFVGSFEISRAAVMLSGSSSGYEDFGMTLTFEPKEVPAEPVPVEEDPFRVTASDV